MDNKHTRTENNLRIKKSLNGWKWAFLTLVFFLIGVLIYVGSMLQPVSVNNASTEPIVRTEEQVVLSTSISKQDAELIINSYLNETDGEDFSGYHLNLTDQVEIQGALKVFGLNAPFSLYFKPYALENGNIQLKAESVQLVDFSLPISGVMSLFTQQMKLPDFIAVDSAKQLVVINLDEMTEDNTFDIEVKAINLLEDDIRLKLYLDKDMISNSI